MRITRNRKFLMMFVLATVALGLMAPRRASAHGASKDPIVVWEQQKHRTEARKTKRREELDDQGAEMRDAKKSEADSKQSTQLQEFGQPNQQTDRWTGN